MRSSLVTVVLFLGGLPLGACRGKVLELGDDELPPLAIPAELSKRCKAAPTTARTFDTSAALNQALMGRWLRCRGADAGVLFSPGIEFASGSELYELVDDGTGTLVRATADARKGSWAGQPPVTVRVAFSNKAQQTLVVLFDPDGLHLSVERSTFDSVDVGYVHE